MKFLAAVVLIALLSFIVCIYLPWWSIAWVALLVIVLVPQKPLSAFLAGFVSLFLLWAAMAVYISMKNDNLLVHKISIIILKINSPIALVLLTGLIGALVGGFAALAGSFLRKANGK